ncbi:MAG: hypothetical protein QME59_05755 [Candidatus Hydrothermarchaeota archaeon]|nr:hypothetical protein [Candidatus Hydrothermarchaeota archaeon]
MPDWVSHVLIGLIICELFNVKKKSLVLLGALLPDLIRYTYLPAAFLNLPPSTINYMDWFVVVAHLPVGIFLLTLFVSSFFSYNYKRTASLISAGWISHLSADFTTKHFNGGYSFLFPYSFQKYELDLLWTEQYYIVLMLSAAALLLIKLTKKSIYSIK